MLPQAPPTAEPGSLRELLRVAVPLVLSSGSVTLMLTIDRIFLTWFSTDALAASMPAGMMHWTVMSLVIGTVGYVNTFVAQYEGAGRGDRVSASIWQGIYLSLAASVVFLGFVPLAGGIFDLIGHAPQLRELESTYFSILCVGALPTILTMVLSCFYTGRGETHVIMFVNFLIAAVNIVLDYLMIFGIGPFPKMGIAGAAWATNIAYVTGTLAYVWLLASPGGAGEKYRFWHNRRYDAALFQRMLRYGLPSGFQFLVDVAAFSMFIFLVGRISKEALAATNLAFNLNMLAFIPIIGFGTAVMTLVGKRVGERRPDLAVRTTWLAFGLAAAYTLAFAVVYVFFPRVILYPYSFRGNQAEFAVLSEQAVWLLRFVALYSFFDALAVVFGHAVRGAGDTRFSFVFVLIAAWSIMVLPTFLAQVIVGGSLTLAWSSCTSYIIIIGVGFVWRFQTGKWKSMRVIEEFADAKLPGDQSPSTELIAAPAEE